MCLFDKRQFVTLHSVSDCLVSEFYKDSFLEMKHGRAIHQIFLQKSVFDYYSSMTSIQVFTVYMMDLD